MHNKVVFRAAKAAVLEGIPCLRFNFRGAGQSQGKFDGGAGEREDARAALDYLATRFAAHVWMMGFSFGATVGLEAGAEDSRVSALVGLGVPAATARFAAFLTCAKPKLIIQGTEDQFGPRPSVQALFEALPPPKRIHWVQGADHFFTGHLEEVQETLQGFLKELANAPERTTADFGA